jgi:UDP-2,4-diacetamido-2,4,6-trideoxy-beta-L-altropyranose hydrolase
MKVAVRADASLLIGTGHVMRCKTLADELRGRGAEIRFICRNHAGNLISVLRSDGYTIVVLPPPNSSNDVQINVPDDYSAWLGVDQSVDAEQTIEALGDFNTDWLVVDHYGLDATWELCLRRYVNRIFVVDDFDTRAHDCDILLNQNVLSAEENRYSDRVTANTNLLLGPKFALLRPQFATIRNALSGKRNFKHLSRINLFMGGSDPTNETAKALQGIRLASLPNIQVDVVIGGINPNRTHIEAICKEITYSKLYVQISEMANLMAIADIGIGSAGSTTWERCCLGLPSIVVALAKNQENIASSVAANGAHWWLGWGSELRLEDYANALRELTSDARTKMSKAGEAICDGLGVVRVAEIMIAHTKGLVEA